MKRIIFIVAASLMLMSCEDFLDTENLTKKNTSNFPETVEDARQMLSGIYSTLNYASENPAGTFFFVSELASDDRLGGGGENDRMVQAIDNLMNYQTNMLENFWEVRYKGIFRANMAIETLDNCTGYESEAQRNHFKGEAYFLRAMFYYEMASLYGQVPLVLSTEAQDLPKAEPEAIYAQIAADLEMAIDLMYDRPYDAVEDGHATKWAAQALMARVFLFYTGFYDSADLPVAGEDGSVSGSITKEQVVGWLEDCINNSGHKLVEDFRELWVYTNEYTVEDYEYTAGEGLDWVENNGGVNPESMFSIKYSNFADWGTTIGYSNQYMLYWGLRGGQPYEDTFPFGQGWGHGPVVPTLWDEWEQEEPDDMRRKASIIDIPDELPDYSKGKWEFVQETDYWQKKYCPVSAIDSEGNYVSTYSVLMYGHDDDMQLGHVNDLILIRYADVLLMHSELTETATQMNKVRDRAGLDPVSYTDENLRHERRWELSFEGVRWNDIRRWGIAADELEDQAGVDVYYFGEPNTNKPQSTAGYAGRYDATKGFFPIPESQISLSEELTQNEGWGTPDANFSGWTN